VRYITKNETIGYSHSVYMSERETGHRNRGIFHLLKNNGLIEGEENRLDNYFKQCSIEITATDLAKIGYFLSSLVFLKTVIGTVIINNNYLNQLF